MDQRRAMSQAGTKKVSTALEGIEGGHRTLNLRNLHKKLRRRPTASRSSTMPSAVSVLLQRAAAVRKKATRPTLPRRPAMMGRGVLVELSSALAPIVLNG